MKKKQLVIIFLLLSTAAGCHVPDAGRLADVATDPYEVSEDEMYLLYPQLLALHKKYDAAMAYYYLGDLQSSYAESKLLIQDIEEMESLAPAPYVCEHLGMLEEMARELLLMISSEELQREWQTHMTTVMDSIGANHVVEEEIDVVLNWRTEHWIKYFKGKGRRAICSISP
jgi:hypothetical protein